MIIASVAGVIYIYGYSQALKGSGSSVGLGYKKLIAGTSCYVVEIVGAIILLSGHITCIYVASSAMIINIAIMITGAWLLMVGLHQESNKQAK